MTVALLVGIASIIGWWCWIRGVGSDEVLGAIVPRVTQVVKNLKGTLPMRLMAKLPY